MTLLLIALVLAVASLWHQLRALKVRVEALEPVGSGAGWEPSSWAVPPQATERVAAEPEPAPFAPTSITAETLPDVADVLGSPAWERAIAPSIDEQAPLAGLEPRSGFEDIFGRRLPIWAGGVTLAVAGFLIVKYSIDAGLLSPLVRVVMGLLFGTALIAGAEAALRGEAVVRDPRVRQALAGAGIASLYAAILTAANLYHLVGPVTAFVGMALVTVLAGGLSIRFGAASAVLGLVGGLAAPALVGAAQPDVPLLTLYLTLAVGGLCGLARHQRWWWLGAAALVGGFGWGMLLIVGAVLGVAGTVSVGLYTLALAAGLPLLLAGDVGKGIRLAASIAGCGQMAVLVALGGFAPLHWGLFGLISIALVWLSRRGAMLADVPALGLGVAVLLGFAWPHPGAVALALMLAGLVAIYAAPAALRVWRAEVGTTDAPMIAASALATGVLPLVHFPVAGPVLPALIGAALAAGVAALGWRVPSRLDNARFATLAITSAALLALVGMVGLAGWAIPPLVALLALGLHVLAERAEDARVERGAWALGVACIAVLFAAPAEVLRLAGLGTTGGWTTPARWAVPAAVAAFVAYRSLPIARVAQPVAVLLGYGAAAQILPAVWLPLVPALILVGFALARGVAALPGAATAALLSIGWAMAPLMTWLAGAIDAMAGDPLYVTALPPVSDALVRLALPALAFAIVAIRLPLTRSVREGCLAARGIGAAVAAHVVYKHLFAIGGDAGFVACGMAERTVWEILLAAASVAAWRVGGRRLAIALGIASIGHFTWFTVLLHNPLWTRQDAGPWLAPSYATAIALVWASRRALPAAERPRGWAAMVLIALFAFSTLRQLAHGSMPLWLGAGEGEDIARSVLAIALAVGFLRFGIARAARDWRIASLALMLAAVVKVFLFDAAGLDGLARIASFAALGFSLIGVGWLYSRYLPDPSR